MNAAARTTVFLVLALRFGMVFCAVRPPGPLPPFHYEFVESLVHSRAANHVEFQLLCDTPVVYRAWGIWNLAYPVKAVSSVALDFGRYERIFRYVYKCDKIADPRGRIRGGLSTWYVEGRAAVARVWSIGTIDSISRPDSSSLRFFASQNEDQVLEATWAKQLNGWLNYRTHGVRLAAFIAANGKDSCRVGIIAQGWVWQPMPQWLTNLATGIILPRLLEDLDKEVRSRQASKPPENPLRYQSWYRALRRFLIF
jgi:hypothetical protein